MIAPVGFEALLQRMWPDFRELRWNELVSRWEFIFTSASGLPVSQFYGWYRNPLTGENLDVDVESFMPPFRDLTLDAIQEIIAYGEKSYLGNREDGARDHRDAFQKIMRENRDKRQASWVARGNAYADLIKEVRIARPWVKHHVRAVKGHKHVDAGNLQRIQVVAR
jgi:hypothetical protein